MRSIFSTLTRMEDWSPLRRFCSTGASDSNRPYFSLFSAGARRVLEEPVGRTLGERALRRRRLVVSEEGLFRRFRGGNLGRFRLVARAVARELGAHLGHGGIGAALPALQPRDVRLEDVADVQQQAHRGFVGDAAALAQVVEERLHLVGRLRELREPEGPAAALDRMRRAEDRVQRLGVVARVAERHRALLDGLQVLLGLVEERGDEPVQVDRHGGFPSAAPSGPLRAASRDRTASPASPWPRPRGPAPSCCRRTRS